MIRRLTHTYPMTGLSGDPDQDSGFTLMFQEGEAYLIVPMDRGYSKEQIHAFVTETLESLPQLKARHRSAQVIADIKHAKIGDLNHCLSDLSQSSDDPDAVEAMDRIKSEIEYRTLSEFASALGPKMRRTLKLDTKALSDEETRPGVIERFRAVYAEYASRPDGT